MYGWSKIVDTRNGHEENNKDYHEAKEKEKVDGITIQVKMAIVGNVGSNVV